MTKVPRDLANPWARLWQCYLSSTGTLSQSLTGTGSIVSGGFVTHRDLCQDPDLVHLDFSEVAVGGLWDPVPASHRGSQNYRDLCWTPVQVQLDLRGMAVLGLTSPGFGKAF